MPHAVNIHQYLDSTYLKTAKQAGISEKETRIKVEKLIDEAIRHGFKSVMLRPKFVALAKELIQSQKSTVLVGTVIDFHEGTHPLPDKLKEAERAINDGADELDVVLNYPAFIDGNLELIEEEIMLLTKLALHHNKTIKWIIEVAALTNDQIKNSCNLIKKIVLDNFGQKETARVFVKSSTGFFKTTPDKPNGATVESIALMVKHAHPLPVKAAGSIKSYRDAIKMINLGVLRIGTSSAKEIATGDPTNK